MLMRIYADGAETFREVVPRLADPTPAEIEARCLAVQQTWNAERREKRRCSDAAVADVWMPPLCECNQLSEPTREHWAWE